MQRRQFRQGDVLIQEVDPQTVPTKGRVKIPKDGNRTILAYGEATGHAHAIVDPEEIEFETEFFEFANGDRFLATAKGISLTHEEHGEIEFGNGGMFQVIIQQEYQEDGSWLRTQD